jgi:DNA-binding LacI/PurR family transcriptional regulator
LISASGDGPNAKRVTLEDVAAQAGVSRALVSIVIRNAPGASAETRKRVLEAADALGYKPDMRARMLARGRSRHIGTVFGMIGLNFQFNTLLLDGLYVAAARHGYELILSAVTKSRDEIRAVETLQGFRPDAVIMVDPPNPAPVLAGKLPVVAIGWSVDDPAVDVVLTDDHMGMAQAVNYLAERGHRRIVHIDGGHGEVARARRAGYVAAMTAIGCQAQIRVISGGETQMEGYFAARALLDDPVLPTAVIAFNDEMAVAVVESLVHAGYRVPQDVSVIGWDNSALSKLPHTRLTTVAQDTEEMSRLAIERAVARIEGKPAEPREVVLRPELMIRATTGAARDE